MSSPRLSKRETQVIAMIACGHSDREIAEYLHLKFKVVKDSIDRICTKLKLQDRASIATWWQHLGGPEIQTTGDCQHCILRAVHLATKKID